MTDVSQRIAHLPPEKLALFLQRLDARAPKTDDRIPKRHPADPCVLSFAQERFWLLDQLHPQSASYNTFRAVRILGPLRPEILRAALAEVVGRHEILRTTFRSQDEQLVQVVGERSALQIPCAILDALPGSVRLESAREIASLAARLPFDLATGPLLRLWLVRLGPEDHVLSLVMHHIISDAWSAGLLIREMAAVYTALSEDRPAALPEPPLQYADFAVWQRSYLQGPALEALLSYWRTHLADLPRLELPGDRPRTPVPEPRGAGVAFSLDADLTVALEGLCRQARVTLFTVLLSALDVLLWRYTGQRDVAIGTAVAGRTRTELESVIGCLVNTLVLRTMVDRDASFGALLARTSDVVREALAHQELPFEKLVAELRPDRDLDRNPLFEVMLVLQSAPPAEVEVGGLTLVTVPVQNGTAMFDLLFELTEGPDGLTGRVELDADLFDAVSIQRWTAHLCNLIRQAVRDPARPVAALELLSAAELHQLTHEWNDTRTAMARDQVLHHRFEVLAGRSPDRVALVCGDEQLSYGELNRRANRVAGHLRRLGVGPCVPVGLCVERSAALLVGMLGILKAGGSYVPLDPSYPPERLGWILEDTGAPVLLTRDPWPAEAPHGRSRVVLFETAEEEEETPGNPSSGVTPDHLAYVIYTSGSTGRPKGVQVTHACVDHLVQSLRSVTGFDEHDVWPLCHSFSFDISVWEIWGALSCGGRLLIIPLPVLQSPQDLRELLRATEVTVLNQTPSAIRQLAGFGEGAPCATLRWVICGGEALPPDLAEQLATWGTRVWSYYGPTETTVWASASPAQALSGGGPVPLGRPLPNVRFHVLGPDLEPVPLGVPGELCIAGSGLARGYFGEPVLTAQRFIPASPAVEPGERFYRTGDLVRRLPDGVLGFLGRLDHQVKVRGFRVELGEIESVLRAHPGVEDGAVAVWENESAGPRLAAFVVPRGAHRPAFDELQRFLRRSLPEHMIPAAFVELDRLPLTVNGKLDRRALPVPDREPARAAAGRAVPRTWVEDLLAQIWCDILRVEGVSSEDDFFSVGGHSLLATQVASRVRRAFSVELPLRDVFEAPRLADLACRIESALRGERGERVPPLVRTDRESRLPLSFAQQRLWFLDQIEPGSPAYNMPLALRLDGALRVEALAAALREIVRRHESLRTRFVVCDGEPAQVIAEAFPEPLPVVDLGGLPEPVRRRESLRLAGEEARLPFDLEHGPVWRARLLRLRPREHALLATMHHIVSDGWSIELLRRELDALYTSFSKGDPSPLPELPVQYADYAVWQRGWLSGEVLNGELSYWRERLAGAPPLLALPWDRPRPAVQSLHGARQEILLSRRVSERLAALAREQGSTVFMVLLAIFQALLARLSGQLDVSVGIPVAGRTQVETEGLIGFFVNTLVLRTDLSGRPTFRELLGRVRETALQAHTHQELPFDKLVAELSPQRDPSYAPLFQVMFNLQSSSPRPVETSGLQLAVIEVERRTAKFDLTLDLVETPEGFRGGLEYATDLLDGSTVCRWAGHLQTLVDGALAAPGEILPRLPLLSEPERMQALLEWNDTGLADARQFCIHELIERQVAATPENPAVICEEAQISYDQLDRQAGALAWRLRELGVGPEVRVGICAERSLELVVGLLAILKAGGAYVPLDSGYPDARLAILVEDSAAPVLLVQPHLRQRLQGLAGTVSRLVDLTLGSADQEARPPRLEGGAGPDNAAYVIFTSGSTGRPKGVVNTHRGVVNRLLWMQRASGLTSEDGVLHKGSFSFDVSVWEIFWPLVHGARLVMARPGGHQDWAYLLRTIATHKITYVQFVPSMLQSFLEEPELEHCRGLRRVNSSGEALPVELAARFHRRLGEPWGVDLHNLYGPTEAAVEVICHVCRAGEEQIPIGRPVDETSIHLMDGDGALVPVGVTGELWIGGIQVARGYLNRPDLTAERFLPDPFGPPGARLYRTGDLARRLPDGAIEFLGRADQQVKIRGIRIELREIELALERHPAVHESVVLAREDRPGDLRLVAYVSPEPDYAPGDGPGAALLQPLPHTKKQEITARQLRASLAETLPDYMVPATFVALPSLPLTPNGKVDRRALPSPDSGSVQAPAVGISFDRPIEEVVAAIWAQTLGTGRPALHDDFFESGGHSLLAMSLLARLRESIQVDLTVRDIFEAATLVGLAQRIQERLRAGRGLEAPPIVRVPRDRCPRLSFAQQRLWYMDQLGPGSAEYNVSVALGVAGRLDTEVLATCLEEIVRRHEVLRTTFQVVDGEPVQVIGDTAAPGLPVVDLSQVPEAARTREVSRLLAEERLRGFDLARGPLLRARTLRCGAEEHVLQLTTHHIACDGGSTGVFIRELAALYPRVSRRQPAALPELPVQYADYAIWQREHLRGEVLARQLAFWKRHLQGASTWLDLPRDRPRPAVPAGRGANLTMVLPPELTRSLRQLSIRQGSSLFVTMLAAFETLLFSLTGQTDFLIGTNIAHRNHLEIEPLIGCFVNQMALRADLAGDPTFLGLLRAVRSSTLETWVYQEVPFEKVVEAVRPERGAGRMPLFQVKIDFEPPAADLEIGGLSFRTLDIGIPPVRLDLLLAVQDDGHDLKVSVTYDAELFLPATVQRWMARFQSLLRAVTAEEEIHLSALVAALAVAERRELAAHEGRLAEAGLRKLQRITARASRSPGAQEETT